MLEQTIRETGSGLSPNGVDTFHTPNTTGLDGGSNSRKALKKKMWLTPKASDTGMGEKNETFLSRMGDRSDQCAQSLAAQVNNPMTWPTPTAHNAKEAAYPAEFNRKTLTLAATVAMRKFPTPQASDNRDRGNMSNPSIQKRVANGKQIMLSQSVDPTSGALNPTWVEWLMGWPLEWTDLKPLEMDKYHCVQPQPGES
jgi:DNA (cytosine-5)-methyltransferase 1